MLKGDNLSTVQTLLAEAYGLPKEAIQPEFFDFLKIVSMGGAKHGMNNWLRENGKKSDERTMHDSIFHHVAESFVFGIAARDHESDEDPLLHVMTRSAMLYTRRQRNIIHPDDES